ncbi:TIGR03571 family LLM class oxidoreductase [Paraburkholderia sp. J7]|uniref:TIGR03571 family LLM class oxidoreductase n=1 Tax=Paraburkholderia sp. J7 TaxID=2805438 RepID=UPI002AB79A47|nr:TIGR03571 family LLM class oxidoreductase [Paraburkholderia sp. J7]
MALNRAYKTVFGSGRMTVGLMTPAGREQGRMAEPERELELAARADRHGFAGLWARDVPLMVPQGTSNEASPVDDPFVWLATLAAATSSAALGTAAVVLPLHNPLHVAKAALSMNRLTGGRFILGLGSGDRPQEFQAFGEDHEQRAEAFRQRWALLASALSTDATEREAVRLATGGYDVLPAPESRIPMIVVGSARQSLQWVAANADGWATYHRDEVRQLGRIGLWRRALESQGVEIAKPFIHSLHLQLLDDPHAPPEPIELGIRGGRDAVAQYLLRLEATGVNHLLLHLGSTSRPALEVIDELGLEVLPFVHANGPIKISQSADQPA